MYKGKSALLEIFEGKKMKLQVATSVQKKNCTYHAFFLFSFLFFQFHTMRFTNTLQKKQFNKMALFAIVVQGTGKLILVLALATEICVHCTLNFFSNFTLNSRSYEHQTIMHDFFQNWF